MWHLGESSWVNVEIFPKEKGQIKEAQKQTE